MLPQLIQGGMGIGVSGWRLAREVSKLGQLGVVSGTAIDTVFVRRLALEGPDGPVRRAVEAFPAPAVARRVLERFDRPDAADEHAHPRFKVLPLLGLKSPAERLWLLVLANFVEVHLAKQGHGGVVGVNHLRKVQLPLLPSLYGAMLAGVDVVLMGAGIPGEVPALLDRLARHEDVQIAVDGLDSSGPAAMLSFSPGALWAEAGAEPVALRRPKFLAIVSSVVLAKSLLKRAPGGIDGFVIEGPSSGGHNAPPRGNTPLSVRGEPVYGPRDEVDLAMMRELGAPFWLAGGYSTRARVQEALAAGARGVQVGTAFAFCEESGMDAALRARFLAGLFDGASGIFTDPDASPTSFPFKVASVPGTLSDPAVFEKRPRICDLGYLRVAHRKNDGSVGFRCPAEPVEDYVHKGGTEADTVGRKCLCNALTADVGLGQRRADGYEEPPLVTAGNDLECLKQFVTRDRLAYHARDVVESLIPSA